MTSLEWEREGKSRVGPAGFADPLCTKVACPDECTSILGNGPDVTGKTDERLGSSGKIGKYQKQISRVYLPDNVQIHDGIEEPIFRNLAGTITGIVSPPLNRGI